MKTKIIKAIIFGPQGSGKGTQGNLLSERLNIPIIGAGDVFRAEIAKKTKLGNLVNQYVQQGLLAPDEVVNAIIARQLKKTTLDKGFIFDGYPRNVDQAIYLGKLITINLAIQLKIDDEEVINRLQYRSQCSKCKTIYHDKEAPPVKPGICSVCGGKLAKRADDRPDIIAQRLKAYHFMTEPLAAYYREKGVLLVINANQSIPYVFEDVIKKMSKLGFVI